MEEKKYDSDEEILKLKTDFFDKIKGFIEKEYETVSLIDSQVILVSTRWMFNYLQDIFPSKIYRPDDVAIWLDSAGYQMFEVSNMRWEWMLKKRNP